jgi:D-glycero-D-manno-heptose 1,7-bisphosphate phosphatase
MARAALLLDRDGVMNVEIDRLHRPEDVIVIPGVAKVVATVNGWGNPVAVITNQAGIGYGLYDEAAYRSVNLRIDELLAKEAGARIDRYFHCPHTPADACSCRKPAPGLLLEASKVLDIDLSRSIFVGDKRSDLDAARAAGCAAYLVRTGYGAGTERELLAQGESNAFDSCRDSLLDALPDIERALRR